MREIKFKCWYENAMLPSMTLAEILAEGWTYMPDSRKGELKKAIFLQFTGLKDKNVKEIYEGDLMQTPHNGYEPREILEVVYDQDRFELHGVGENKNYITPLVNGDEVVIGNIYENPELLK